MPTTLSPAPPAATPPSTAAPRRDFLFAGIVLAAVLVALAAMTWQKWPDLLVDFGVQLYIPWKLASGAVLYRDVAYLTGGPLSQYFDALIFRVFGASVLTLVFANLAMLVLLLVVVYRSFYRAADQLTALAACLAILLAFAFEHYSDYGIFNYVTPYSEEIYHGVVLSILAVALLCEWVVTQNQKMALAAGFCGGLVFLTKAEVFLALAVTFLAAIVVAWRSNDKTAPKGLGLMAFAAIVPPLGFFIYFLRHGSLAQSLAWTCWAWTPLVTTSAAHEGFYRWCLGLDAPGLYLKLMVRQFLALAAILAVCAFVFSRWNRGWRTAVAWVALAAPLAVPAWRFKWEECGYCLPLLAWSLLALVCWRIRKSGWQPESVFGILWAVFSLVLLAKLGFHSRIWHYGFALAMPAFLGGIYLILRLLPDALESFSISRRAWRLFFCAFLGVALLQLTLGSKFTYQKKTVPVADGADRLWTFAPDHEDDTGACMAEAFTWMQANTPPQSTLATLPSVVMLNFLLRRSNPSGYLRWNPTELAAYGQDNMVRAFEDHPPDYVLLLGVDNSEFGVHYFGDKPSFGQDLTQWIDRHYRQIHFIGDDWKKTARFGIQVLQFEPSK